MVTYTKAQKNILWELKIANNNIDLPYVRILEPMGVLGHAGDVLASIAVHRRDYCTRKVCGVV